MSLYFQCNFIWFDVDKEYTKVSIRKVVKGEETDVELSQKGFVSPTSICEESVWNNCVIYLFHHNYYMNIVEYNQIDI